MKKILLLGSGELGKELVISLKRLGATIVAVDRYANAPAMQVADSFEVIDMLDGAEIERLALKHKPDLIVPEIEAIRTEKLLELEKNGFTVIPTAKAVHLTMNRDAIRNAAAQDLKLKTAKFTYAENLDELVRASEKIKFPCVIKPVMSSSGKGQSVARSKKDLESSWNYACNGMRGDKKKVIIEEFINFEFEITLLTIRQNNGKTIFVSPIGHRQERGDYRESWLPAKIKPHLLKKAQSMAKKMTNYLGGFGLFGVEFFICKDDVYFSELSPRPHDTGMVTLISQNLSEFDLHARAILGLPIADIEYYGPSASAVVLALRESESTPTYSGVDKALNLKNVDVRIFGKPNTRPYRRMAVTLARDKNVQKAKVLALKAARLIKIQY